jgi:hypothetical protein
MAGYTAIEDVGDTVVGLLRDGMADLVDSDEIELASPATVGKNDDVRLTVFLYRVTENAELKNQPRQQVDEATVREAPLELDLHYLMTAHPAKPGKGKGKTAKTVEQHRVLGRAMQVLYDNSVLRGSTLAGSLDDETLYVSMDSQSTDTVVNLWSTFQDKPFRPSVTYLVSPVAIDSTEESATGRVVERTGGEYSFTTEGGDDG